MNITKKPKKVRLYPHTFGSKVFDVINITLMILLMVVFVYPFLNQLAISFNDGFDTATGGITVYPRKTTLENFEYIIQHSDLLHGAKNTLLRTIVGTVATVFCTGLLAYIVTLQNFSGRRFMRVLFIVTMYFSGGMIPTYLIYVRVLHLNNTFTVYWLPSLFGAYYMMLMASYIQNLPSSLIEAAHIDGASYMRIYFQIIVPISLPVFACIGIYTGVGQWNSWFDTALYNGSTRDYDTLQIILRRVLIESQAMSELVDNQILYNKYRTVTERAVSAAITMIVTVPIIIIYPFFQRFFVGGLTLGAVKE